MEFGLESQVGRHSRDAEDDTLPEPLSTTAGEAAKMEAQLSLFPGNHTTKNTVRLNMISNKMGKVLSLAG